MLASIGGAGNFVKVHSGLGHDTISVDFVAVHTHGPTTESGAASALPLKRLRPTPRGMTMGTLPGERQTGTNPMKSVTECGAKRMELRRGIGVDPDASANVMPISVVHKHQVRCAQGHAAAPTTWQRARGKPPIRKSATSRPAPLWDINRT